LGRLTAAKTSATARLSIFAASGVASCGGSTGSAQGMKANDSASLTA